METISILSVPIHNLAFPQALQKINEFIEKGGFHQVCTVNPEFIIQAMENETFRKTLENADLNVCDGVGLQIGALLQGKRFRERITGVDLVYRLVEQAAEKKWRVFLLGAGKGVAKAAAEKLLKENPNLLIKYSGEDPNINGTNKAIFEINSFKPHVLFVAYGSPTQDLWIVSNKNRLSVLVAVGVGGTFDFITGKVRRAPRLVSKLGFEWAYRLLREPWRYRRQARLVKFIYLLVKEKISR